METGGNPLKGGEDLIEVEEVDNMKMPTKMTDSRMRMMVKIETSTREIILEISEIEDKVEEDLKVILEVKVEAEVDLTKVPM